MKLFVQFIQQYKPCVSQSPQYQNEHRSRLIYMHASNELGDRPHRSFHDHDTYGYDIIAGQE